MIDTVYYLPAAAFTGGMIGYMWWRRKDLFCEPPLYCGGRWSLPVEISEKYMGCIEGQNPLLHQVIVVAHRVEEPTGGLLSAVRANFARGVVYRFLISDSSYEEEKDRYIRIFEGYANISSSRRRGHEDLVLVERLGMEWDEVPYLFYLSKRSRDSGADFIFGYSGSQIREGIADKYVLMGPRQSRTIYRMVLMTADSKALPPAREELFAGPETADNIVPLKKAL